MPTITSSLDSHCSQFQSRLLTKLNHVSRAELATFLSRYGAFNRAFAGAALGLASRVHLSNDLLGDEPAAQIASFILGAVLDEYFDPTRTLHITHRDLCDFFLLHALNYLDNPSCANVSFSEFRRGIMDGYQLDSEVDSQALFSGIGYHMAAERSGAMEFTLIDEVLRTRFPELVQYLRSQDGLNGTDAYTWVSVHTFVEEEHFAAALKGLDCARGTCKDLHSRECFDQQVEHGIAMFFRQATSFIV